MLLKYNFYISKGFKLKKHFVNFAIFHFFCLSVRTAPTASFLVYSSYPIRPRKKEEEENKEVAYISFSSLLSEAGYS